MAQRKLSETDHEEIVRQLRTQKYPGIDSDLARQFGVSRQRISQIKWSIAEQPQREGEESKEKMEEYRETHGGIPYRTLNESPIAIGEYFIEVTRLYRNDGSGTSYLRPSLGQCILERFTVGPQRGEEYRWVISADYSRELQEKLCDYLHSTYGEQIVTGYYPCESTELIQAATWKWSEQLRKGKEQ